MNSTNVESSMQQYTLNDENEKPAAFPSSTSSSSSSMPIKKRSPRVHKSSSSSSSSLSMHPHKRIHQMKKRSHKRILQQQIKAHQRSNRQKNYGHINRVKFALFLKVLMKHLSLTNPCLHDKAKMMIRECIMKQRSGDLQDTPLMSALKGRLFGLVGSKNWDACDRYLESYLEFHEIKSDL